ncbi:MAG: amino acid ABC transporter permease [Propionibacteriales bacterium]|nr:amino acid ABC transporter permease [Propionibacteriales bacterium]
MNQQASVLFDAPGPRAQKVHLIITIIGWVLLIAAVAGVLWGLRDELTPAKLLPFADPMAWTGYLLPGLGATLAAAATSVVTAIILGVLLGCGRLSGIKIIRIVCGLFVEFFRAVPVLLMMVFSWYFFIFVLRVPSAWQSFAGVVVGLTFYNGSVIAELIRSGVHSLPKGQSEAGLAVGLTPSQVLTSIQLPQAITAMLPSLVSQLVVILKDTALGSLIVYSDVLKQATELSTWKGNLIATFIVVALIFIVVNYALTSFAQWLERRLRARGARPRPATAPPTAPGLPTV